MSAFVAHRHAGGMSLYTDTLSTAPDAAIQTTKCAVIPTIPAVLVSLGYSVVSLHFQDQLAVHHVRSLVDLRRAVVKSLDAAKREVQARHGDITQIANRDGGSDFNHFEFVVTADRVFFYALAEYLGGEGDGYAEQEIELCPERRNWLWQPSFADGEILACDHTDTTASAALRTLARLQNENQSPIGGDIVRHEITRDGVSMSTAGFLPPVDREGHRVNFYQGSEVLERVTEPSPIPAAGTPPKPAQPPHASTGAKISRNAPCPCGSGRKAKRCCHR
jgi:hypothetical protein